ncbi:N-acetylglucosamine-6-phosphate deacetylase [Metabacillus idriensis]|uniref:N-acetylglucosamine-6-phosphate deacetylase n=1 Tax=Metabacillus idriensis TaxID=324768 RepID=UPI00174B9685|nr:N-acetylglucosamine-6-phosphate deacetylase [Metabacillus idriensis]
MPKTYLTNAKLYTGEVVFQNGFIIIENNKITGIGDLAEMPEPAADDKVFNLRGSASILPGFIDIHIHGAAGADVMDATKEAILTMSRALPKEGTTSYLATTMTAGQDQIKDALKNAADYIARENNEGAEVLGIHLEGPFLNPKRAGAQAPGNIIEPSIEIFNKWRKDAKDHIKLVTLAPECKNGYELARHLTSAGITASIGHSDAVYSEVEKAVESGVNHATHLFNGMRGIHHREPGVAGTVLMIDEVKTEMIVDGIHIAPEMVKFAYKVKGSEGTILITDAMRAKGLGAGKYDLGGQEVTVDASRATLADGTLAGSILTFRDAAVNMMNYTGCSLEEIVKMSSVNPAKQIGVYDRKGSLSIGKDADIVVLDENSEVLMTFCRGKISFTGSVEQ